MKRSILSLNTPQKEIKQKNEVGFKRPRSDLISTDSNTLMNDSKTIDSTGSSSKKLKSTSIIKTTTTNESTSNVPQTEIRSLTREEAQSQNVSIAYPLKEIGPDSSLHSRVYRRWEGKSVRFWRETPFEPGETLWQYVVRHKVHCFHCELPLSELTEPDSITRLTRGQQPLTGEKTYWLYFCCVECAAGHLQEHPAAFNSKMYYGLYQTARERGQLQNIIPAPPRSSLAKYTPGGYSLEVFRQHCRQQVTCRPHSSPRLTFDMIYEEQHTRQAEQAVVGPSRGHFQESARETNLASSGQVQHLKTSIKGLRVPAVDAAQIVNSFQPSTQAEPMFDKFYTSRQSEILNRLETIDSHRTTATQTKSS
jgi:hypothetical protein